MSKREREYREEEENFAEQSLLVEEIASMTLPQHPAVHETMKRMVFDSQLRMSGLADEATRIAEDRILGQIESAERRRLIHLRALNAAKTFWEERINQPDLTPNEIILARRRLTTFTARLETFGSVS